MKVSLNGNELKLVQTMLTTIDDIRQLQEYFMFDHNFSEADFEQTYKTLSHKLAQQLGKPQIKIEVH